jgi:hypothetical protein
VARYAERTGRDVSRLRRYETFALWKASVFREAIYGRFLRGERDDPWASALSDGRAAAARGRALVPLGVPCTPPNGRRLSAPGRGQPPHHTREVQHEGIAVAS